MQPGPELGYSSVPDLHEYPKGSVAAPDGMMSPVRRVPAGLRLIAVGWLDGPMEFAKGETAPGVVSRLLDLDLSFMIDEGTRGFHGCYYCTITERILRRFGGGPWKTWAHRPKSPFGHGHILVHLDDVVYMCPALLPHYVVAHGYRPPDVFQEAVTRGKFLTDADLVHTGEDFFEVALQQALSVAETREDTKKADACRARLAARREELRRAGRNPGFRDPDTGVWRDARGPGAPVPAPSATEQSPRPPRALFDHVLIGQLDESERRSGLVGLLARLRARWRG